MFYQITFFFLWIKTWFKPKLVNIMVNFYYIIIICVRWWKVRYSKALITCTLWWRARTSDQVGRSSPPSVSVLFGTVFHLDTLTLRLCRQLESGVFSLLQQLQPQYRLGYCFLNSLLLVHSRSSPLNWCLAATQSLTLFISSFKTLLHSILSYLANLTWI